MRLHASNFMRRVLYTGIKAHVLPTLDNALMPVCNTLRVKLLDFGVLCTCWTLALSDRYSQNLCLLSIDFNQISHFPDCVDDRHECLRSLPGRLLNLVEGASSQMAQAGPLDC
ncbi:hypothetical protein EUGRSUZ_C04087 [Eucalyptus grandis]|uniref:Uncharacterized protein n=2 Tax=Eucalyptus grandis TaxID=71139 RepID=A0ACC3LKL0_EUCGR|nr:hypothetical protein EUGRSUZ_C04087 [Eucalyptus grandis]